ncbi:MAG: mandelate racemase/muconate lactonizing enzyme family protein, partial [Opitutaceae bacterium]
MSFERIGSVEAWRVRVPFLEEWLTSPEFGPAAVSADRMILRIADGDGHEGWGEGGFDCGAEEARDALRRLTGIAAAELRLPLLDLWASRGYYHQPAPPSAYAPDAGALAHRLRHPLQSAVEMALLDLLARRAGVPLCVLLGGPWRDRVAVDYWMGRVTPEHARRCVIRGRALGFSGIKLKTSLEDPNVERLEAIRDAGGPGWKVTVDPNGRFHRLDDAWPTVRAMDAVGNMAILEDPFPRFHLREFAALRSRLSARVAVHVDPPESLQRVLESGAAGGLNIDSAVQGLLAWRFQAAAAAQANLSIWHGSGLDLGVATAAQLHLAASAPNCRLPGDQSGPWLREATLVGDAFKAADGLVAVPSGPGLGVAVDRAALE